MKLRPARTTDAEAISALIGELAFHAYAHADGAGTEKFFQSVSAEAEGEYIASPRYLYRVAMHRGQLIGVVALRDQCHLFHLFVRPAFQRQGLARRLWESARAATEAGADIAAYTVNSTEVAVPVYQRFGFAATGPATEGDGIRFVPMRLVL